MYSVCKLLSAVTCIVFRATLALWVIQVLLACIAEIESALQRLGYNFKRLHMKPYGQHSDYNYEWEWEYGLA